MKKYFDIEEYDTIDELLDAAERLYGPGVFVTIGRMGKRNMAAYDVDPASDGETVVWPGERVPNAIERERPLSTRRGERQN